MDPRRRHVDRDLAHGDAHPARPLVAQAQDALVVRDHDEAHVVERGVGQDLRHAPAMLRGDPEAAGPPEDPAVLLAGQAHGGGVDDGQELLQVVTQDPVEEVLVAVLQGGQADVALEGIALADDVAVGPAGLLAHRAHHVGEQALERQLPPLLPGERGGAIAHRVVQELGPAQSELDPLPAVRATLPAVRLHVTPLSGVSSRAGAPPGSAGCGRA